MESVFNIFQKLKEHAPENRDGFVVVNFPSIIFHRLGISEKGEPLIFVKCDNHEKIQPLDIVLEIIDIRFNRQCKLISDEHEPESGNYTIVSLRTDSEDLQQYFLDVILIILEKLPQIPSLKELKFEAEKLIDLFSRLSKPAIKTVKGLWAELLVIERSVNPDYLLQAWHKSIYDKFDFNDGKDKIEVKSTSQNVRIHTFSSEQLIPNENSSLIIASVFVIETGIGTTIFDLLTSIEDKLKDKSLIFSAHEIVSFTLGEDLEKSFDIFFDYQFGADSIKFYDSTQIPSIDDRFIPNEVSNVKFDSDLTNINPIQRIIGESLLHKALF